MCQYRDIFGVIWGIIFVLLYLFWLSVIISDLCFTIEFLGWFWIDIFVGFFVFGICDFLFDKFKLLVSWWRKRPLIVNHHMQSGIWVPVAIAVLHDRDANPGQNLQPWRPDLCSFLWQATSSADKTFPCAQTASTSFIFQLRALPMDYTIPHLAPSRTFWWMLVHVVW